MSTIQIPELNIYKVNGKVCGSTLGQEEEIKYYMEDRLHQNIFDLRVFLRFLKYNGADLRGASLQGANFRGADLRGAKFTEHPVIDQGYKIYPN